jgi:CRP/FNR family transcriptional regulator, anaerobic regulatory protein
MRKVLEFLKTFCALDEGTVNWLHNNAERIECKKKAIVLHMGEICEHVWFIEIGLLRAYEELPTGKEICNWFMKENDIATAVDSFFTKTPSRDVVQAEEDCVLWRVSRKALFDAFLKHPNLTIVTLLMIVRYYRQVYKWASFLRRGAQDEMYADLMQNDPELFQRVTVKDMASFLGISEPIYNNIRNDYWGKKPKKR